MLDDNERETLREVERRLMAEDPEFVNGFQARQSDLQGRTYRRGAAIAIVVAVLLVSLMLAAGSIGGAVLWAGATAVVWGLWRRSAGKRRTR